MDKILDQARKLQVIPLVAGVFICYVGQFVAELVTSFMGFSASSVDIVSHPELASVPQHFIFRPLVGVVIWLAIVAVAGYVAGMLALVREVQHGAAAGIIFTILNVMYIAQLTHRQDVDTWPDWLVIVLTVPVAMWGAGLFAKSAPRKDASTAP